MRTKITSFILSVGFLAALAAWCILPVRVDAQAQNTVQRKPANKLTRAGSQAAAERPPREVTMTGRVVSVHAFMTGQGASPDQARTTADNIRAGVPAALDTQTGLILLGQGATSAGRTLIPLAYQEVEVHGKLYEKGGLKYIDIDAIDLLPEEEEEVEADVEVEEEDAADPDD